MMLRLLLARHGESQWQTQGDEAGFDSPLTELGRRQAKQLGYWLADHCAVNYVYASPLKRAQETAQLVASHLDLPVNLNRNLKEAWFVTARELPSFLTPLEILDGKQVDSTAGTTVYCAFRSLVAQALKDILSQHSDGTILIVAHVGTIATAIRLLLGSDAFSITIGNTTLHSLNWDGARWQVEYIDRREHLEDLHTT
jgi:broad specificity phosphatase PhoE